MAKRNQKGVERRYCTEYVMKNYPEDSRVRYNAPLGLPPSEVRQRYPDAHMKFFKPWRKYTDAIVIDPPYLDVIECKVWAPEKGFSDLLEYRELLPETPELQEFTDLTPRLFLVIPFVRPHWERMAHKYNINLILWRPDWLVPPLKERGLI